MAVPPLTLYMFEGSNACLTATLMLGHKGLACREVRLPPVLHAFAVRAMGFPGRTVPALRVGRGRLVQGTGAIARVLDELAPERPLLPPDPLMRAAVETAERRGEELQDMARRLFYCAGRRDVGVFEGVIVPGFRGRTARAVRRAGPALVRIATAAHGAWDRAARADLAALPGMLDEIDRWIAAGVLDGPELNVADFQIGVNTRALLLFEDIAPHLEGRPLAAHARRVAPSYRGWVPCGVLPRRWMAPLAV